MIELTIKLTYLESYLIIINLFSFLLYGFDKIESIKQLKEPKRISELNLLLASFIGGTLGSLLAMLLFRHKISKVPFIFKFIVVIIIQISIVYFAINHKELTNELF